MGCWGTGIYSNDFACDIRAEYIDGLKKGKSNIEVTNYIIERFGKDLDEDDEPIFWFTLSDMQWNYGRLLDFVKEKALYFVDQPYELTRWEEAGNIKSG